MQTVSGPAPAPTVPYRGGERRRRGDVPPRSAAVLHQIEEHLHGPDRDELRAAAFSSMQAMSVALGVNDGGGPASFQLAMIRGGSAPGSFKCTALRSDRPVA